MVRALVLETSQRLGRIALAEDGSILSERLFDEPRRQARDLTTALRELLAEQGWASRSVDAVFVSRGPGSYTGLRVGLMSAKTFAYATGCALLAIDTFDAIANQALASMSIIDVVTDAQQDKLYVQRFTRSANNLTAAPLAIVACTDWLTTLSPASCVIGPGLETFASRLPADILQADREDWFPRSESVLKVALERWHRGERDDLFQVEPLYLRPSAAEEQWKQLGRP